MSKISGKIIRVNNLPPKGERLTNVIYQVAVPGTATYIDYAVDENGDVKTPTLDKTQLQNDFSKVKTVNNETPDEQGNIDLNNYIQLYNSEEEFQILFDEGLKNKIYYNSATEVIRIGLLDSDGFKEYNFSEIQKIPQLKTALDNEIIERARIDALKINKPTTNATSDYVLLADGSTAAKGDLGKNFANTDLVVSQNRKHIGIASLEFAMPFACSNTSIRYSGLKPENSKHNDATYNRLLGMDSNGNINEVGLPALTNEMSKSTDAQKEAHRIASRKTDETYSLSQPRVDNVLPPILLKGNGNITVIGANLFLDTRTTLAKVETIDSRNMKVVETITNISVHQIMPTMMTFTINTNLYVNEVNYYIRITHNGLTSLINTGASFIVLDNYISQDIDLDWEIRTNRSKVEPKTYTLTESNVSDILFTQGGKNSLGEYESDIINILSKYEFNIRETYIIQMSLTIGISQVSGTPVYVGFVSSDNIPSNPNTVLNIAEGGITKGGHDVNRWFMIPAENGNGRGASGQTMLFTLILGGGICKIYYKEVMYLITLVTPLSGNHKMFINYNGVSNNTASVDLKILNIYKKQ